MIEVSDLIPYWCTDYLLSRKLFRGNWRRHELAPLRWRRLWGGGVTALQIGEKSGVRYTLAIILLHQYNWKVLINTYLNTSSYSYSWIIYYIWMEIFKNFNQFQMSWRKLETILHRT